MLTVEQLAKIEPSLRLRSIAHRKQEACHHDCSQDVMGCEVDKFNCLRWQPKLWIFNRGGEDYLKLNYCLARHRQHM